VLFPEAGKSAAGAISPSAGPSTAKIKATRLSLPKLAAQIWRGCTCDSCLDLAAQVSFYFVLSAFPFLLVMSGLLGWISTTSKWAEFAVWLTSYMPMRTQHAVLITMLELGKGYGAFLSFGLILTIWSASTGFLSLMDALSVAFRVSEQRSYVKRRLIAMSATIVAAVFVVACFAIWSAGHSLASIISSNYSYAVLFPVEWKIARWVATLVMICLGVDLINYFLPGKHQRWKWISAGTTFTVVMFILASIVLNFYMTHNSAISRVYGTLAGFIFLMFWIYAGTLSLIVGAETDVALREMRAHGTAP
jgi:membrane protein